MRWILTSLVALFAAGAALVLPSCSRSAPPRLEAQNVLFITLDTTRADRIGCYGYEKAVTPVIDSVAARGVLFENAIAQVPLTLPSHASMLTGRYPREHGVRDNGRNAVGEHHPTLATIFKEQGYRTGAFVASFVLDSQFGLARGFDVYEDDMGKQEHAGDPFHAQQPANVITDRAMNWLTQKSDQPFFAWVHYYDAHDPYMPPPEFRGPDRNLYDGELAFIDTQLKRIFDWLSAEGLNEKTLVIIAGDHGESFNEHGERGHTNFVYATNMHVPLIFAHPKAIPAGKREKAVVELVDIFPTVLELFGIPSPVDLMARPLNEVFAGKSIPSHAAYSESLYVFNSYGWAEQRAMTTARWKYISTANPELFDLSVDPGETKNLVLDEPRIAADLLEQLQARFAAMPMGLAEEAETSADAGNTLASMGYFGGSLHDPHKEVFLSAERRDPKEMRKILDLFRLARALVEQAESKDDYAAIVPLIRDIALECPDALMFQYMHGYILLQAGKPQEAIAPLDRAIVLDPKHRHSVDLMAEAHVQLQRYEEALQFRKAATEIDRGSGKTRMRYALALENHGKKAEAVEQYRQAVSLEPELLKGHARLCALIEAADQIPAVAAEFDRAFQAHPPEHEDENVVRQARAELYQDLGTCYARIPDHRRSMDAFRAAAELVPDQPQALCNLGIAILNQAAGAPAELRARAFSDARAYFERAAATEGFEAQGTYQLAESYRVEGNIEKAIELYHEAARLKPAYAEPIQRLALYYREKRQYSQLVAVLDAGIKASPNDVWLLGALGQMLATSGDPAIENCAKAVSLLEHAANLTTRRDPLILANLCAAHACAGRFDRALAACQAALPLAEQSGNMDLVRRIQDQIERIRRNERFIDPRLSAASNN